MIGIDPMFPNVDGIKRILDEAQALSNEVQEVHKMLLRTKDPQEIAGLEARLRTVVKRIEDFRKQYWEEETTRASSEQPDPEQNHK